MRLQVVKAEAKPGVAPGHAEKHCSSANGATARGEARQTKAPGAGEITIDLAAGGADRLLVERASDGECDFCLNEFPAAAPGAKETDKLPALSQVTIFWDASGSRGGTDHQRELAWLKSWFAAYSKYSLTVNLVPFRNALGPAGSGSRSPKATRPSCSLPSRSFPMTAAPNRLPDQLPRARPGRLLLPLQ